MVILIGLLMGIGYFFGGLNVVFIMFLFLMFFNFIIYWYSDRIVLSWYNVRIVDEYEVLELYVIVRDFVQRVGFLMFRVVIILSEIFNVFVIGRDFKYVVVVVIQGFFRIFNRDEFEGVIGYELIYIKNRDILIGMVVVVMVGVIMQFVYWVRWIVIFGGFNWDRDDGGDIIGVIFVVILVLIVVMFIQVVISRLREFLVDEGGVRISGKLYVFVSVLMKIEQVVNYCLMREGNLVMVYMFIVNLFRGMSIVNFFLIYLLIEVRIERFRKIVEEMGIYF